MTADDLQFGLFFVQARTPSAELMADYTPGDANITLSVTTFQTGTLIWIGSECLALGAHAGAGVYPVTGGIADTSSAEHTAGTWVYTRCKFLKRRRYRMVVYDWDAGVLQTRSRGYIEDVDTSEDGTRINVKTLGGMSMLSGAMVNRDARRVRVQGTVRNGLWWQGQSDHVTRVHRDPMAGSALQVGDSVATGAPFGAGGEWWPLSTGPNVMGAPRFSPSGALAESGAREIFIVDGQRKSISSSRDLDDDGTGYWRHRIAIALGFLRAGAGVINGVWDRWARSWGLGLDASFIDIAQIEALIARKSPDVDQMVIGWDGQAAKISQIICDTLLRPDCVHVATTQDGRIRFGEYRMPTILDAINAPIIDAIPGTLKWAGQLSAQFTAFVADVGKLPWRDPDPAVVDVLSGEVLDATRSAMYETRTELRYDFSTWARNRADVLPRANAILERARTGSPLITLRCHPLEGDTLDLGRWYRFSDIELEPAFFVDGTGERISTLTLGQSIGYLVSRKYDVQTGTYTLGLLAHILDARLSQLRAPSAIITSGVTSATLPVDSSGLIAAGDFVQVCNADLSPSSGELEVVSVTPTTIVVESSITVTTGQVVRLATFGTYGVGADIHGAGRSWSFIGDASDNLIENTEPADTFG